MRRNLVTPIANAVSNSFFSKTAAVDPLAISVALQQLYQPVTTSTFPPVKASLTPAISPLSMSGAVTVEAQGAKFSHDGSNSNSDAFFALFAAAFGVTAVSSIVSCFDSGNKKGEIATNIEISPPDFSKGEEEVEKTLRPIITALEKAKERGAPLDRLRLHVNSTKPLENTVKFIKRLREEAKTHPVLNEIDLGATIAAGKNDPETLKFALVELAACRVEEVLMVNGDQRFAHNEGELTYESGFNFIKDMCKTAEMLGVKIVIPAYISNGVEEAGKKRKEVATVTGREPGVIVDAYHPDAEDLGKTNPVDFWVSQLAELTKETGAIPSNVNPGFFIFPNAKVARIVCENLGMETPPYYVGDDDPDFTKKQSEFLYESVKKFKEIGIEAPTLFTLSPRTFSRSLTVAEPLLREFEGRDR